MRLKSIGIALGTAALAAAAVYLGSPKLVGYGGLVLQTDVGTFGLPFRGMLAAGAFLIAAGLARFALPLLSRLPIGHGANPAKKGKGKDKGTPEAEDEDVWPPKNAQNYTGFEHEADAENLAAADPRS